VPALESDYGANECSESDSNKHLDFGGERKSEKIDIDIHGNASAQFGNRKLLIVAGL
jgi:hypothetical protein